MSDKVEDAEDIKDIYKRIEKAALEEKDAEGELAVIEGLVIPGNKLGRTVGFCTANLELDNYDSLDSGAYIARVEIDGEMLPALFLMESTHGKASVHLFNFSEDIYNETLSVSVVKVVPNELLQDLCKLSNSIRK
jgi:FAD synthase